VKLRVPIWKNEHYADGESGWLHPDNTPVDRKA
jgi:molybdopterin synthase catalytic subunit